MYIDRSEIIEKIRESILTNDITYIFGYKDSGKTTLCNKCLEKYFSDTSIHIIYPYLMDEWLKTLSFTKDIYIFEDYDNKRRDIIPFLKSISSKEGAKFVLLSRKNTLDSRVNVIETNYIGSERKVRERIYKFYNFDFLELAKDVAKKSKTYEDYYEVMERLLLTTYFDFNIDLIYKSCIVDSSGKSIYNIDEQTKIIVTEINDELLYVLSQNPKLLYNLSPYEFERVIAKMFEKKGFSVKITPQTRDGGKDIFVAKNDLCSFLFYVECKKYAPDQHVGIDVIQRLYGVVSAEKATGGIIATTSYFTKPAKNYIQEHQLEHQLTLQDYDTISDILKTLQHNTQ